MTSGANRIKAGKIVAKEGRYYGHVMSESAWHYAVYVNGKHFHAADTAILADKVAEYLDSLEPKKGAQ